MPDSSITTTRYRTLLTPIGKEKIAAAILTGEKVNITQAAVGDGGGAYYLPVDGQTDLRNECWRGDVASYEIGVAGPSVITAKFVVPSDVGGFFVREASIIDDDGDVIAVCNTPTAEKVPIFDGASFPLTVVMHTIVEDASVVEFTVNPILDSASREDLSNAIQEHSENSDAHADIRAVLVRENILINADFREPVDTKRGHIVPPDTPYYSDTGLSAQAGAVSVWTEVKKESGAYGAVTVGGSTYYVEWSAAVAGYNRNGVTVDGWSAVCYSAEGSPVLMTGSGLKLVGNHQIDQFGQGFSGREAVLFSGKTVTISILCRGTKTTKRIAIYGNNYGNYILRQFVPSSEEVFELFSATAVFPESVPVGGDPTFRIHQSYVAAPENDWLEVRAVKVELGDHQTLAHQDESGRWVLNEAPNKAKQLALCSQYDPDTGAFQDSPLAPAYTYGTSDLTAGVSPMINGRLHFVYE